MINGNHPLYGEWDYETNYSEGSNERNRKPLYKHFGYGSPGQMKEAQQRFAQRRATSGANDPMLDFENLEELLQ